MNQGGFLDMNNVVFETEKKQKQKTKKPKYQGHRPRD